MKKFVIIATARSGSSMLRRALDSHSQIICHDELLRPTNQQGFKAKTQKSLFKKMQWEFFPDYTITKYLDSVYDNNHNNPEIRAIGFKMLYPGQFNFYPNIRSYWFNKQVKIIRLHRRNLLKIYLSDQIAHTEKTWASTKRQKPYQKIAINTSKLLNVLHDLDKIQQTIDSLCAEFSHITITYKDLVDRQQQTFARISEFLEVDTYNYEVSTSKRNSDNLEDLLANYKEVEEVLGNTMYEEFLDL